MSIKSRLFASVAAPLVSLPLMVQPALAVPPKAVFTTASEGDVIRVQQPLILPPGTVPEEEEEQQQQEEAPAEEPAQEEAPAEAAPEPAPEAQQEAPAEVQPEPEPEPEAAPEPEVAPEPEPEPEPEAAPEPQAEPEVAPAEPEAEEPAEDAAPQPEAETPAEEAPAAESAPATEEAPATTEQPSAEEAPAAQETAPTATEQQPDATAPAAEAPADSGTAPATDAAPADGDAATAAPATEPAQQTEPAVATTPAEVERAQQLAEDPSSAEQGETVVLPVENGAAVLDSQKESVTTTTTTTTTTTETPAPAPVQSAEPVAAPTSDAEAQAPLQQSAPVEIRAITSFEGQRIERAPEYRQVEGWSYRDGYRSERSGDTRIIISIDNRPVVRHDDTRRFYGDGGDVYYEQLPGDRYREVVERRDGVQVVTIRNSYGVVVQRSRIIDGEEYVLYYDPALYEEDEYVWRDPGRDLPPMRLTVPVNQYIIDTSSDPDRDYYEFLELPPVERVERVYSIDEVRYSARIRDKARRIDLDTIKFATGSAEIPMNQAPSLRKVAEAMKKILDKNPAETFLVEGHTDAVGSDESNLILSDERAESVAVVLTDAFGIPPENLTTQGYGERYLKIKTEAAQQENRRVTIRRITSLVKPVASNR